MSDASGAADARADDPRPPPEPQQTEAPGPTPRRGASTTAGSAAITERSAKSLLFSAIVIASFFRDDREADTALGLLIAAACIASPGVILDVIGMIRSRGLLRIVPPRGVDTARMWRWIEGSDAPITEAERSTAHRVGRLELVRSGYAIPADVFQLLGLVVFASALLAGGGPAWVLVVAGIVALIAVALLGVGVPRRLRRRHALRARLRAHPPDDDR